MNVPTSLGLTLMAAIPVRSLLLLLGHLSSHCSFLLSESSRPLTDHRVGKHPAMMQDMMHNQNWVLSNRESILWVYKALWRVYADIQIVILCAQDFFYFLSVIFLDLEGSVGF